MGIEIRLQRATRARTSASLWIDIAELRGLAELIAGGSALPAAIGPAEQPRLTAERDAAQRAFGGIIGEANAAVVEEAGDRIPALEHVETGLGRP